MKSLKSKVDKLNIGKLETTPVTLSKLSKIIKKVLVKKTESSEIVKKASNINTTDSSSLVEMTDYNTKINQIEKKY